MEEEEGAVGVVTLWAESVVAKHSSVTKLAMKERLKKRKNLRIGHQDSGERRARKAEREFRSQESGVQLPIVERVRLRAG